MDFKFKLAGLLLIIITITSCKKEASLSEYKYADKSFDVTCNQIDADLLKEAVYSFENDITKYFARNGQENLSQAYSRIVGMGVYGRAKYEDIVSDHTIEIFNLLKEEPSLWNIGEKSANLNYDHELVKCLSENIRDKDLKTTFNALLTTNSMTSRLFGEPLRRKTNFATKDKYLATYIALDLYYAKLFNVELNLPKDETLEGQSNKDIK